MKTKPGVLKLTYNPVCTLVLASTFFSEKYLVLGYSHINISDSSLIPNAVVNKDSASYTV